MSNGPNPPSPAPKPSWFKAIIARPVRATFALLVLTALAVLSARTAVFAFSERLYKSTAQIGPKWASKGGDLVVLCGGGWGQTITEELRSPFIAERAKSRMRAMHPEWALRLCQVEAANIPNTYIFTVSATSTAPSYAQGYLDAVIHEFLTARMEEVNQNFEGQINECRKQLEKIVNDMTDTERALKACAQSGANPQKLIKRQTDCQASKDELAKRLEQLHGEKDKFAHDENEIVVLERPLLGQLIYPSFTFFRLF